MPVIDDIILRRICNRGHAGEDGILGDDQPRAYTAQEFAVGRLILELRAKFFRIAKLHDPRQYPARKGDAPLGQESEGEITRETRSQSPAQPQSRGFRAAWLSVRSFNQCDFARFHRSLASRHAPRPVKPHEARPRQDCFGADPAKRACVEMRPKRDFLGSERPKTHVPRLARQGKMAGFDFEQGRHAKASAWPHDKLRAGLWRKGADRLDPRGFEDRQAKSLRFEIIEEQALIEPRLCRYDRAVDRPIRVRHLDDAPADRAGGAGDQRPWLRPESFEDRRESVFEARKILCLKARPWFERRAGRWHKRKPSVRAANVAKENRRRKFHAERLS
jgi:hypothetical protein